MHFMHVCTLALQTNVYVTGEYLYRVFRLPFSHLHEEASYFFFPAEVRKWSREGKVQLRSYLEDSTCRALVIFSAIGPLDMDFTAASGRQKQTTSKLATFVRRET